MPVTRRTMLGASVPVVAAAAAGGQLLRVATATAAAELLEVDVDGDVVLTLGFHHAGDGGGALYRRVATEPPHAGKLRAKGGGWFELAEAAVRPEMFGARADGGDDRAALQAALDFAVTRRGRLELTASRYALAGHLVIGKEAHGFVVQGIGLCRLEQLQDNCSIFYFQEENSTQWAIRGVEFAWTRDQGKAHPLSYAIRFDTRTDRVFGHYNFEVADCEFINGWRGIGVTPEPFQGMRCPIWGATLRNLRCGQRHGGALVFVTGFGKSGQPNIALEHVYIRGDAMAEAALRFNGCDTVELRGVEFNFSRGTGVEFVDSVLLVITATRFERGTLPAVGAGMVVAEGPGARAVINGLTLQSCEGWGAALLARRRARIVGRDVVTTTYRKPETTGLVIAATQGGGAVSLDGVGHFSDPSIPVSVPDDQGVSFAAAEVVRLRSGEPAVVTQPGVLAEAWTTASPAGAARVVVSRDGADLPAVPLLLSATGRMRLPAAGPTALAVVPGDRLRLEAAPGPEVALVIARA